MKFYVIICWIFAILAFVFADVHMPDVYDRNENYNGLYVPELSTGNDRKLEPSVPQPYPGDMNDFDLNAFPESLHSSLGEYKFASQPFSTDLINPQKWSMPRETQQDLGRKNGGAVLFFKALHMSHKGNNYNALIVTDRHDRHGVRAYWLAQGGYVDIPLHPQHYQPQFVLTAAFSGCSLTVDLLERDTLRVRHVQGGYENTEYNNNENNHGFGLMGAMEYKHYGYHPDNTRQFFIENVHGTAFLQYIHGAWRIKFQRVKNPPAISKVNGGGKSYTITNRFSSDSGVVSTEIIHLRFMMNYIEEELN